MINKALLGMYFVAIAVVWIVDAYFILKNGGGQ